MSSHSLTGFNDNSRKLRDAATLVTPTGESIDDYGEAKLTTQWRSLKKRLGLGTIFLILTGIASSTIAVEQLIAPAVGQSRWNGETDVKLAAISKAQTDSEERQSKTLEAALKRIEDAGAKNFDLSTANSTAIAQIGTEVRALRDTFYSRLDQVQNKTDSNWNWLLDLKGRVNKLENDSQPLPKK